MMRSARRSPKGVTDEEQNWDFIWRVMMKSWGMRCTTSVKLRNTGSLKF
jgi:hypothetical protein